MPEDRGKQGQGDSSVGRLAQKIVGSVEQWVDLDHEREPALARIPASKQKNISINVIARTSIPRYKPGRGRRLYPVRYQMIRC